MSVASVNERLAALTAAGTSVWLDQIRRGMIEDGELARMVASSRPIWLAAIGGIGLLVILWLMVVKPF